ncbi:MAG: NAD(P) transhydrogenase subunit alpha [Candidatus Glassbacteria bacterium RIFCSPLOWO2_12_FULL_58_11]|uniref:NAD(P) transhydrogenase subunit alpha part 1 n=1 Tax=Candidatus Glassbacteria bacterium RIFCSPLOWO2_12_FULL_58_11 TaxID=1817867 RepID=A0A1F5YMB8_9BACT|nr:MAG: NAD(P) transhydrogenase subunit alpha [Candidatus Glassbacteria bacterium RIFCSPLOWO2_12_FULL_58_11]
MIVGIPKETFPGQRQVSVVPDGLAALSKAGLEVLVQAGSGAEAGYADELYSAKGAKIVQSRTELFQKAEIILQYQACGANPEKGPEDLELLRPGQVVIAFLDPLGSADQIKKLAERKATGFSMELMPRITKAQSMDALSSQASLAGYKAVILAAEKLPQIFPMMMTAAGTISPARVFVIGAGVAGLQAIATARRLGAVVSGYDVRPAVKDQVESLGAKFVEMALETGKSEDAGGYAKAMDENFYRRQRELMTKVVAENHVVITTAAVPGKKAPILITGEMVKGMRPGSIIVDLAAERGGNCELTRPGENVEVEGVTIMGPVNLTSTVPHHSSQMYSKNITTFLIHMAKEGQLKYDLSDEITRETLVTRDGEILEPRVREILHLPPLATGTK